MGYLKMKKIGFDIDGVILDLHTHMIQEFKKQYNIDLKMYLTEFNFNIPGLTDEEISNTVDQAIINSIHVIQPYTTVEETLTKIFHETKDPILFITARNLYLKEATKESLDRNFKDKFDYEIIFTNNNNKLNYIKKYNISYFVEDNPETCNDICQFIEKTFLVNRMYNTDSKILPEVIRINRLIDMFKYL